MPKTSRRTPEDRSQEQQKRLQRVKKGYKVNVKARRKFEIEGEEALVKDMVMILKLANYSNVQIATIVGVSRGQVKEYLQDVKLQKKLLTLRERLPEAALELMRGYLIEAVQWVVHIGRTSQDEALVLKAAAELFDRAGIAKVSRSEQIKPGGPLDSIDRSGHENVFDKFDELDDEARERAAQLYDSFEQGLKLIIKESKGVADETPADS